MILLAAEPFWRISVRGDLARRRSLLHRALLSCLFSRRLDHLTAWRGVDSVPSTYQYVRPGRLAVVHLLGMALEDCEERYR